MGSGEEGRAPAVPWTLVQSRSVSQAVILEHMGRTKAGRGRGQHSYAVSVSVEKPLASAVFMSEEGRVAAREGGGRSLVDATGRCLAPRVHVGVVTGASQN